MTELSALAGSEGYEVRDDVRRIWSLRRRRGKGRILKKVAYLFLKSSRAQLLPRPFYCRYSVCPSPEGSVFSNKRSKSTPPSMPLTIPVYEYCQNRWS